MDASELLACYAAGERDFSGFGFGCYDLSGANLFDANLPGIDLSGTLMVEANLMNSNLSGADLSRVDLTKAKLGVAYLSKANLSRANLREACLREADLSGADLSGADLSGADLSGADLSGADLSGADLSGAGLSGADLSRANLFKTLLTNTSLSGANLNGTILGYERVSEEVHKKNQELIERVKLLEAQLAQLAQQKAAQDLIEVSNQGIKAPYQWEGFYFRSRTEIKIAEALDRASVLFYPNSKARLNKAQIRVNKESDFLIFRSGRFGILEVDGRESHQTAADDHERDRLFKRYGIRVIERFDATRCWNEPDKVVKEFLEILSHA